MFVSTAPGMRYILTEWYLNNYPYMHRGLHTLKHSRPLLLLSRDQGTEPLSVGGLQQGKQWERQGGEWKTEQTAQGILRAPVKGGLSPSC